MVVYDAVVAMEDQASRRSMALDRSLQGHHRELPIALMTDMVSDYMAAVEIHDRGQINIPRTAFDVGDVEHLAGC